MKTGFNTHHQDKPLKRQNRSTNDTHKGRSDWRPEVSSLTRSEWRQIVMDLIG